MTVALNVRLQEASGSFAIVALTEARAEATGIRSCVVAADVSVEAAGLITPPMKTYESSSAPIIFLFVLMLIISRICRVVSYRSVTLCSNR